MSNRLIFKIEATFIFGRQHFNFSISPFNWLKWGATKRYYGPPGLDRVIDAYLGPFEWYHSTELEK